MTKHYDIIINGGGIVGFTLLNLISKSRYLNRLNVLLIEQAKKPSHDAHSSPRYLNNDGNKEGNHDKNVIFSNRVSSITGQSREMFIKLGIWPSMANNCKDVNDIQVWNYEPTQRLSFKSDESINDTRRQRDTLFSVIENNRLSSALLHGLDKSFSDNILWEHNLNKFQESQKFSGAIDVIFDDKTNERQLEVSSCLLLGCDGFQSKVRQIAGIPYKEKDLKKKAVVGTVRMSDSNSFNPTNNIAYQRFSNEKDTVAALLPLDDQYCSFVISCPTEYSNHLESLGDSEFVDEFNNLLSKPESSNNWLINYAHKSLDATVKNLSTIIGSTPKTHISQDLPHIDIIIEGSRASFPLYFGTTSPNMVAKIPGRDHAQIALLGDSAHRIHPLAGQGLNLGIQDAEVLVDELEKVLRYGENPFALHDLSTLEKILKRYECRRQIYLMPMTYVIMEMPDLFKIMPSSIISLVDKCNPLKNLSVKLASGSSK